VQLLTMMERNTFHVTCTQFHTCALRLRSNRKKETLRLAKLLMSMNCETLS